MPEQQQTNNLYDVVISRETLKLAWHELNKPKRPSYGLSGVTLLDFKKDLDSNLDKLHIELVEGTFSFSPTRAALMPKDDNKGFRPLQIPEVKDRIVMKALAIILEDELKPILAGSVGLSFAYQKGLSRKEAVERMQFLYNEGYNIILKADIISFFTKIDKNHLLTSKVYPALDHDKSLNDLIKASLSIELQGISKFKGERKKYFKNLDSGIPQGNPLSPLLSNVYLTSFDKAMKDKGLLLIRYADDFLVMCKSEEKAREAFDFAQSFLEKELSLSLYPLVKNSKSKIINICKSKSCTSKLSFLGIEFDGQRLFLKQKKITELKEKIRSVSHKYQKDKKISIKLKEALNMWISAYEFVEITPHFKEIDTLLENELQRANKYLSKELLHVPKCQEILDARKETSPQRTKKKEKRKNRFSRFISRIKNKTIGLSKKNNKKQ